MLPDTNLDRPQNWDSKVDQHAIVALTQFESMLRTALAEQGVRNFDTFDYACTDLIDPVLDLAWALMRPVSGTSRRALHFMQTPQFMMPFGFNTPAEVASSLSCGSLSLRRCILAVIASLLLPASICNTLVSEAGRGTPFWTTMRSLHSPDDRRTFQERASRWNPVLREVLNFYW